MKERIERNVPTESRLLDIKDLCAYTKLGRNNAMKFGQESGARVQYGRRVLYDRVKLDEYIESMREKA